VLDMQKHHISIEHEIRLCTTAADTVCMWKNLTFAPAWLHGDVMLRLENAKVYMNTLVEEKLHTQHTEQNSVPFTSIRALEYDLIKSGECMLCLFALPVRHVRVWNQTPLCTCLIFGLYFTLRVKLTAFAMMEPTHIVLRLTSLPPPHPFYTTTPLLFSP